MDLLPPGRPGVAESLAQARQNLSSLVDKAKQIILHLETGSSAAPEEAEEELVIRVKRKRASNVLHIYGHSRDPSCGDPCASGGQ